MYKLIMDRFINIKNSSNNNTKTNISIKCNLFVKIW